jgi:integrase
VFRWAVTRDIIDADPAASVIRPADEQVRKRFLSDDEIRQFWRACAELDKNEKGELGPAGRLFRLCLVTAQRRGEVAGLRRSELGQLKYKTKDRDGEEKTVSGDAWLLPGVRTKRAADHTVPLSPLAKSLIDEAPKLSINGHEFDCVLASGASGDRPLSGWSRYKARLDALIGRQIADEREEVYDPERHRIEPWHIHDLRATAATIMEARLQIPARVISRILNHAEGDGRSMTARYVRYFWDAEAAGALNRWAGELGRIVGLNVVRIADAKA